MNPSVAMFDIPKSQKEALEHEIVLLGEVRHLADDLQNVPLVAALHEKDEERIWKILADERSALYTPIGVRAWVSRTLTTRELEGAQNLLDQTGIALRIDVLFAKHEIIQAMKGK